MKQFAFVSEAAEKAYKNPPDNVQDEFGKDLRKIQYGQTPILPMAYLDGVGQGIGICTVFAAKSRSYELTLF